MNEKVTKLAIASRVIILFIQFVSNILIPDHSPTGVFQSPKINKTELLDKIPDFFLGGLLRWDAEYFLHVSENGYTYENTLAFYPLFPGIVGVITKLVLAVTFYASFRYVALMVATILNIYFFYRAANCLYDLTQKIFGDLNKSWNAVILFCFNPASIFFSAPYSEGLFCWLTFSLMLECVGHQNILKTTITLGLSILCRSNGLVNIGFAIYFIFRKIFLRKTYFGIFKLLSIIAMSLIPLSFYNFYIYHLYCQKTQITHPSHIVDYANQQGYILAGPRHTDNSPWCDRLIPFPYSYVQSQYWNVGLFEYYQLKQIPNFLIAAPVLVLLSTESFRYFKMISKNVSEKGVLSSIGTFKSLPFVIHAMFLTIFCSLFVHIQISTRFLASSSPCLYWFAADYLPKTFDQINLSLTNIKSKSSLIVYWFGSYFIVGTILFSNFYPWT